MQIENDEQACAYIGKLQSEGTRTVTEHANGAMVWHSWGEGPALVLLHGGSGSWTHWIKNIPFFRDNYQVVAGDLPGLGDSPSPVEPYSVESLSAIISSGLDEVVPATMEFHLVGFSFGGIVGGHIASLQAARIRSLTIVGSPPFGLGSTGRANDIWPVDRALSFEEAEPLHRRNLATFMIEDERKIDALAVRVHHDNLRRFRLRSRKIARTDTLARAMWCAPCPIRGVWGDADATVHPGLPEIEALFKEIQPNCTFDALPGVGHWVAFEASEVFNQLLHNYLAGK